MELEKRMSSRSWQLLITLSVVWGFSFLFNALLLTYFSTLWIVFFRLFLGGLFALFIMICLRQSFRHSLQDWIKLTGQGLLGVAIPFTIIIWAQYEVASGHTSVLVSTAPLFGIVFSSLANVGEPIVVRKLIGVLIGICGVGLMLSHTILAQGWGGSMSSQLAILLACSFYAMGSVYTRRFYLLSFPAATICTGSLLGGSFVILPFAVLLDGWPPIDYFIDSSVLFSLVCLGMGCTGLAYLTFYPLLKRSGSNVFLCTLISPWIALLLGMWVLSEPFEWVQIFGMVVIVFSLLIVDGRINLHNNFSKKES